VTSFHYKEASYYDLLEVSPEADAAEVEEAYRRQMEMLSGESLATYGLFVADDVVHVRQRVEEAYRVLSDPARRGAYDASAGFAPETVAAVAAEVQGPSRVLEAGAAGPPDGVAEAPVAMADAGPGDPGAEGSEDRVEAPAGPADAGPMAASMPPWPAGTTDTAGPPEGTAEGEPDGEDAVPEEDRLDGPAMRAARERKGVTLSAISVRTRIAEYYLEDIEDERFDRLPPPIYLRSYIRQYAAAVGVDEERAVEAYMARYNDARGAK